MWNRWKLLSLNGWKRLLRCHPIIKSSTFHNYNMAWRCLAAIDWGLIAMMEISICCVLSHNFSIGISISSIISLINSKSMSKYARLLRYVRLDLYSWCNSTFDEVDYLWGSDWFIAVNYSPIDFEEEGEFLLEWWLRG